MTAEIVRIRGVHEFEPWRAELDRTRSGAALLDALISPRNARALVRRLPSDDLHAMIRRIGLSDCAELLALTTGEQVRDLLDAEVWVADEIAIERVDSWLGALMHAGHDVLLNRVMALDDELINWVVRRSVRVVIAEDPESYDAEDLEHVVTPDGRMYIYFPESADRDLPMKLVLDGLMRADPVLCVDLLVHSSAALDSNLQEQAYRWRSGRMADRGYVDYYEALVVYTPPRARATPQPSKAAESGSRRWLAPVIEPELRLADAFGAIPAAALDRAHASLGYLANMAFSADRVEAWDMDAQADVLRRVRAGLVLGLDALTDEDGGPAADADVLTARPLSVVFRHGYARMVEAAAPLQAVRSALRIGPDVVGAVDLPALRPWAEALTGRHPTRLDGSPLTTAADLADARAAAESIAALARAAGATRPVEHGLGAWLTTWLVRDLVGLDGPGRLPSTRLEDAHRALFSGGALRPEAADAAHAWWVRLDGGTSAALDALLDAATDAMAGVAAGALDPRFLPLLTID